MKPTNISTRPGMLLLLTIFLSTAWAYNFGAGVGGQATFTSYDDGLFTPLGDLNLLSSSEYTTLNHPIYPRYNVRVKQSNFCDGSVR